MKETYIKKAESVLGLAIEGLTDAIVETIITTMKSTEAQSIEQTKQAIYHAALEKLYKLLDKPWGQMVEYINHNPKLIDFANNLARQAFANNYWEYPLTELLICLLEHNNILFHKTADYTTYQNLANCLYQLAKEKKELLSTNLKIRYYLASVYSDNIFRNEEYKNIYETRLLESAAWLESNNSITPDEKCVAYINISQFYLFQGNLEKNLYQLEKARGIVDKVTTPNYRALFWYHYAWAFVEQGNYGRAAEVIDSFFTNVKEVEVSPAIYLHGMNIGASISFRLGKTEQAFALASKCLVLASKFYERDDTDVIAENLVTISKCYLANKDYENAEKHITQAIRSLDKIFGGSYIDPSQAAAHVVLGDIYTATQKYKLAKDEYLAVEAFYEKVYQDKFYSMNEVSIVLANLAILGHKSEDKKLAKEYFNKLTTNFPADYDSVKRVKDVFSQCQMSIT